MNTERERIIKANQKEFKLFYNQLSFIAPDHIIEYNRMRDQLVSEINSYVSWGYHRTKVDCSSLSKGCELCGEGTWSCLFINNKCNANCFYCPTSQNEYGNPTTQTIEFPEVEDYISYLKKFGFKGVSISGGEPLLSLDKSLHFIKRIRESFGKEMYIWLYTNGILANSDNLNLMKEAGLDEIRFDIGAAGYNLEKVRLAKSIIPVVTVEIPAIPEDFEKLKNVTQELAFIGVDHLNLHQIRCTEHNYTKLLERNYTFLHGPKITVLESELTALRLIQYIKQNHISLPVNYCSFIYKYRFQRMAARQIFAPSVVKPHEEITETGIIRDLFLKGEKEKIRDQFYLLRDNLPEENFALMNDEKELHFKKKCWRLLDFSKFDLFITYSRPFILPAVSYRNIFKEISLNRHKKIVLERSPVLHNHLINANEFALYESFFINNASSHKDYRHIDTILETQRSKCRVHEELDFIVNIFDLERLRWGLLDYF